MIAFFLIIAVLTVVGVAVGLTLYVLDRPTLERRLRIEAEAQEAAWRIHQHAREAFARMLEAARDKRVDGS